MTASQVNVFDGCREVGDTEALVVTAIASLKDADGDPLYSRKHPAKVILACDKALCPKTDDVTKFKVLFTLNNTGPLKKVAPPCPKKGVIGKDQEACVDYEQSFRRDGDLYLPFLFARDAAGQLLLIERAHAVSPRQIRDTHVAQLADSGSGTRTTPSDPRAASASCSNCAAPGSWRSTAMRAATASRNPRS